MDNHSRDSVDPRWWYAGSIVYLLFVGYVLVMPSVGLVLSVAALGFFVGALLVCVRRDMREIRRSGASWTPNRKLYSAGALLNPLLLVYACQRYRHVGFG